MSRRARGIAVLVCLLFAFACGGQEEGPDDRLVEQPIQPEPDEDDEGPVGTPAKTPHPDEQFDNPIEGVRTVSFPSEDGTRLVGRFFGDDQERKGGVVLVHRHGDRKGKWFALALELMERGYAALAFDLRGHGQSEGTPDEASYPADIEAALEILRVNNVERAAAVGVEEGGTAAIGAAAAWEWPMSAAVTIGSEPTFKSLDVSSAARELEIPVLVFDEGSESELADLIEDATFERSSEDPDDKRDGPMIDAILSFLDDHVG